MAIGVAAAVALGVAAPASADSGGWATEVSPSPDPAINQTLFDFGFGGFLDQAGTSARGNDSGLHEYNG